MAFTPQALGDIRTELLGMSEGTFAGAFFMGDGIVRTDSFASSAMDTFVLVDEGFSVYHGNGAFGAGE